MNDRFVVFVLLIIVAVNDTWRRAEEQMRRFGCWTFFSSILHRLGLTRTFNNTAMTSSEENEPTSASSCNTKQTSSAEDMLRNEYGYYFNEDGEMRSEEDGSYFKFDVHDDRRSNQQRYEEIGKVVEKVIYEKLQSEGKLSLLHIPLQNKKKKPSGFIFRSADAFDNERLLLIIHGSGVVRAGQWSRRLIINHCLNSGSQLPYIKKARELGYGVLVLNSNQHCDETSGNVIKNIDTPEKHFDYVWNEVVKKKCVAKHVAIIAHSYGGHITVNGASKNSDVIDKTFAVALTDSVHYSYSLNEKMSTWMDNNVCNWVSHSAPLDEKVRSSSGDCQRVSAGTTVHEETSWKAFDSVWTFIERKWKDLNNRDSGNSSSDKNTVKDDTREVTNDSTISNSNSEKDEFDGETEAGVQLDESIDDEVSGSEEKQQKIDKIKDVEELMSQDVNTELNLEPDNVSDMKRRKIDESDDSEKTMSQDFNTEALPKVETTLDKTVSDGTTSGNEENCRKGDGENDAQEPIADHTNVENLNDDKSQQLDGHSDDVTMESQSQHSKENDEL